MERTRDKLSEDASWPDSEPTVFLRPLFKVLKEDTLKRRPIPRKKEQTL